MGVDLGRRVLPLATRLLHFPVELLRGGQLLMKLIRLTEPFVPPQEIRAPGERTICAGELRDLEDLTNLRLLIHVDVDRHKSSC